MITTSNIYYAGFLLSEAEIVNVETAINNKDKKYVLFHFTSGDDKTDRQIEKHYEEGSAVMNVRAYIDNLVSIRDIVFRMNSEPVFAGKRKSIKENISKENLYEENLNKEKFNRGKIKNINGETHEQRKTASPVI